MSKNVYVSITLQGSKRSYGYVFMTSVQMKATPPKIPTFFPPIRFGMGLMFSPHPFTIDCSMGLLGSPRSRVENIESFVFYYDYSLGNIWLIFIHHYTKKCAKSLILKFFLEFWAPREKSGFETAFDISGCHLHIKNCKFTFHQDRKFV